MEYIETLRDIYEKNLQKFNINKNLIKVVKYNEYESIGRSSVYLFIRNKFEDTENFYEQAIVMLEDAITNQDKFIESTIYSEDKR